MSEQQNRVNTSTQIRNLYSDGMSYLNMKFYNTNLSLQFTPFVSKDNTGKSTYDQTRSLVTTINWDSAFALHKVANEIINKNPAYEISKLSIPCNQCTLDLERRVGNNGPETILSISKNNASIPFKFATHQSQVMENNQMVTKIVESGLGVFAKTLEGYLTGINADRHLDKFTEDYVKSLEGNKDNSQAPQKPAYQNNYQNNNYNKNNNYRNNNYQNKGGYKKPYNNYNNQNNNSWETQQPNQQNMSTYQIG